MNRNVRIAKELVKLAKSIVSSEKRLYTIHLSINLGESITVEADDDDEAIKKAIEKSKGLKVSEFGYEDTHVDNVSHIDYGEEDD